MALDDRDRSARDLEWGGDLPDSRQARLDAAIAGYEARHRGQREPRSPSGGPGDDDLLAPASPMTVLRWLAMHPPVNLGPE